MLAAHAQPPPGHPANVWAGDAVAFEAPLGLIRLPSPWQYAAAVISIFAAFAISQLAPDNHSGLLEVFTAFGLILAVITLISEIVGRMNRASALRLRGRPTPDLHTLAERCWLRPFTTRVFSRRFDVDEWIRRSGPDGPRLLLREVNLPPVPASEDVFEETDVNDSRESRRSHRIRLWLTLVICGGIPLFWSVRMLMSASRIPWWPPLLNFAIISGVCAYSLGVNPFRLTSHIASPGRLSCVGLKGSGEFSRDDSIMLIEPIGTSDWITVYVIRRDGLSVRFRFRAGADNPVFQRLISRWCWRDGRGADHAAMPTRDLEPCPDAPIGTAA